MLPDHDDQPLDPLTGLYAGMIGELALVNADLALTVEGLIDFVIRTGVVSRDQLTKHLAVYREHHEMEMRDRMLKRLHYADESEDDLPAA
jgi:hypothetical protein